MGCKKITYYESEGSQNNFFLRVLGSEKKGNRNFFGLDYYPYGKVLREYNPATEKYLTTHHERDTETGFDYRGARYYDADITRFLNLDPHATKYPSLSDYNYVAGNPIIYIDPDGKDIYFVSYDYSMESKIFDKYINNEEEEDVYVSHSPYVWKLLS